MLDRETLSLSLTGPKSREKQHSWKEKIKKKKNIFKNEKKNIQNALVFCS